MSKNNPVRECETFFEIGSDDKIRYTIVSPIGNATYTSYAIDCAKARQVRSREAAEHFVEHVGYDIDCPSEHISAVIAGTSPVASAILFRQRGIRSVKCVATTHVLACNSYTAVIVTIDTIHGKLDPILMICSFSPDAREELTITIFAAAADIQAARAFGTIQSYLQVHANFIHFALMRSLVDNKPTNLGVVSQ